MQRLVSLLEKISDRSKNASNVTLANEEFLELATSLRETLQGEEGSTRKRLLDALQELGDRPAIRPEDLKKERRAQESGAMQQAEQQPTGTDTNPSHGATATVVRQATGTNEVLQPAAKRQRKSKQSDDVRSFVSMLLVNIADVRVKDLKTEDLCSCIQEAANILKEVAKKQDLALGMNLELFVTEACEGSDIVGLHAQLLEANLSPLFPFHGLSFADFKVHCGRHMSDINQARERGGTRELKGIYPLLFSNATGYRCDVKKVQQILKDSTTAEDAVVDAQVGQIAARLRSYPFPSNAAIDYGGASRSPLEHLRDAIRTGAGPTGGGGKGGGKAAAKTAYPKESRPVERERERAPAAAAAMQRPRAMPPPPPGPAAAAAAAAVAAADVVGLHHLGPRLNPGGPIPILTGPGPAPPGMGLPPGTLNVVPLQHHMALNFLNPLGGPVLWFGGPGAGTVVPGPTLEAEASNSSALLYSIKGWTHLTNDMQPVTRDLKEELGF